MSPRITPAERADGCGPPATADPSPSIIAHTCHACKGSGALTIGGDFERHGDFYTNDETCPTCDGDGVIYEPVEDNDPAGPPFEPPFNEYEVEAHTRAKATPALTDGVAEARLIHELTDALRFYADLANWAEQVPAHGTTLELSYGAIQFKARAGWALPAALADHGEVARAATARAGARP